MSETPVTARARGRPSAARWTAAPRSSPAAPAASAGRSPHRLAADGAHVTVLDRDKDNAHAVAEAIGGEALVADLGDPAVFDDLDAQGLSADILVNNAGLQHVAPIEEFDPAQFTLIQRVLLEAPFRLTRALLPGMYAAGWGRVVHITSVHGHRASPYKVAYVSAKHGLEGLSKVVAMEAAGKGVTSNTVAPGYVRTALVENQIASQAQAHGITEDEVLEQVLLARTPSSASSSPRRWPPPWPTSAVPAPTRSPAPRSPSTAAGPPADPTTPAHPHTLGTTHHSRTTPPEGPAHDRAPRHHLVPRPVDRPRLPRHQRDHPGAAHGPARDRVRRRAADARDLHPGLHAGAGQLPDHLLPAVPAGRPLRQAHGRQRGGARHRLLHRGAAGRHPLDPRDRAGLRHPDLRRRVAVRGRLRGLPDRRGALPRGRACPSGSSRPPSRSAPSPSP